MANFHTHLIGGALVSGAAAIVVHARYLTDPGESQVLFTVGVAASLLPDIDADDSTPARALFGLIGILLGFLVAFALVGRLRIGELVLVWIGVWGLVRYPLQALFARLTVHRGSWHTLLTAVIVALTVAVAAERLLGLPADLAWLGAGFALLGFLTHLVLDEAASVDLFGSRIKRSFGTAMKPLSLRAWPITLCLFGLLALLLGLTPDPAPVLTAMGSLGLETGGLAAAWPRW